MPPLVIPALVVSTVVSTGLSIASAAGAFDPDVPELPEAPLPPDTVGAAKARRETLRTSRRRQTVIGGQGVDEFDPAVARATILGS